MNGHLDTASPREDTRPPGVHTQPDQRSRLLATGG